MRKFFPSILILFLSSMKMAVATEYVPVIEKAIYITKSGIRCNLYDSHEFASFRDWCHASGSIDVRVNVAQMRSVKSFTSYGVTPDAKFVRFTVEAGQEGTGIHLVDDMVQGHSWFQSWANRRTYMGPFVNNYDLWVNPVSGYMPNKVGDSPKKENKKYQHRDTIGYSIGINGSLGAEVGKDGPKLKADVSASFSYKNEKTLVFDTHDYRVNNRSSSGKFEVSFEREFSDCESMRRRELACYFTTPLWGSGWVFDRKKFNPISYANFKPNFDVLYEAPVDELGTTEFDIGVRMTYKMLYGLVVPSSLYSVYGPSDFSWGYAVASHRFRVDWSHPLFEPEAHVSIQSLDHNNLCLGTFENDSTAGFKVRGAKCRGGWNQTWGLDNQERYRSRSAPDRCLTVLANKNLAVRPCKMNLSQKWYWEGERLFSRYVDDTGSRYVLTIVKDRKLGVAPESNAKGERWKPSLQQIDL